MPQNAEPKPTETSPANRLGIDYRDVPARKAAGPIIDAHTHVKDAVHDPNQENAMDDGWKYVPPGEGQLPLEKALNLLKDRGYDGYVMFEHEKRWHPTLPEPEDIMPMFVSWFKGLNL